MAEPKNIYEDDCILVLDKPAGWVVNSSQTTKGQTTVQDWLDKNFRYPLAKDKDYRSGIVHRLDKDTSGLLLVAKTKRAFDVLQQEFKQRQVQKQYMALVHGKMSLAKGSIKVPVGRLPWNRKRFGIMPGGRESETGFEVVRNYIAKDSSEGFSLLRLFPKTGRTHQIRIHLKYIHHPIVADSFYAGRKTSKKDLSWCPRLFLHAQAISFVHPETSRTVSFETKLPKQLSAVLEKLD
jgi:23S rRNA pseudouridine1911/1915/1917 synthase